MTLLLVFALGVLVASTTGGGESSGSCDETVIAVDICEDGGQQPAEQ